MRDVQLLLLTFCLDPGSTGDGLNFYHAKMTSFKNKIQENLA